MNTTKTPPKNFSAKRGQSILNSVKALREARRKKLEKPQLVSMYEIHNLVEPEPVPAVPNVFYRHVPEKPSKPVKPMPPVSTRTVKPIKNILVAPVPPVHPGDKEVEKVSGEALKLLEDDTIPRCLRPRDIRIFRWADELYFPTTPHLIYLAESTLGYFPRRLKSMENMKILRKRTHDVWLPVWELDAYGRAYLLKLEARGRLEKGTNTHVPERQGHTLQHPEMQLVNTLIVKLAMGADEEILYDGMTGSTYGRLPILTGKRIDSSAVGLDGDLQESLGWHARRVLDMPGHPAEGYREAHPSKGVIPVERDRLLKIYRDYENVFFFNMFKNKEVFEAPHFVILRPHVGDRNYDNTLSNLAFNHDACRLEVKHRSDLAYQRTFHETYMSGLYGKLHCFTHNSEIKRSMETAWEALMEQGLVSREHADFLSIRPLPKTLNNTNQNPVNYSDG